MWSPVQIIQEGVKRRPVWQTFWPIYLGLSWLVMLTAIHLLFGQSVIHPVDARSGEPLTWMHLEYPDLGSIIEPFAAPAEIMNEAPDIRVSIASLFLWAVALTCLLAWWRNRRLRTTVNWVVSVGTGVLLYVTFMLLVPLPSWRLVVDKPGMVVADLHSHTCRSHDGLLQPLDNLRIHRDRGFDVVGITDHGSSDGGIVASNLQQTMYPDMPPVLAGMEIHAARDALLIAVGLKASTPLNLSLKSDDQTREWIARVHELHHGAVIALYLNRYPSDIAWLKELGIDAIEIVNRGHPELQPDMRAALRSANDAGLPLVASSDLHGWGALWNTWTVIRQSEQGSAPEAAVLLALREHRAEDIYPVSSHPVGAMTRYDAIIAPFVSVFHYARELSLSRLMSWWVWSAIITLLWRIHTRAIITICMSILCGGFLYQGSSLLLLWARGLTSGGFVGDIGAISCVFGALCLMSVWGIFVRGRPKRREAIQAEEITY